MDEGLRARLTEAMAALTYAEALHADALDQLTAALQEAAESASLEVVAQWVDLSPTLAHYLVTGQHRREPARSWHLAANSVETCWHLV